MGTLFTLVLVPAIIVGTGVSLAVEGTTWAIKKTYHETIKLKHKIERKNDTPVSTEKSQVTED